MRTTTTFASAGWSIGAELFLPAGTQNGGVVIVAHGSDGLTNNLTGPWRAMIEEYCNGLAEKGFVALTPHYFDRTGTPPGAAVSKQFQFSGMNGKRRSPMQWLMPRHSPALMGRGLGC
jgi:dienelactone hydrolase